MKYCSKCGTPAEDNQNFCLNCGSRLTAPVAQAAADAAATATATAQTAQGQLAAQQQLTATAAQTAQEQLAAQQAATAQAAAAVTQQQQAVADAAAQTAATVAQQQQAAADAAAQVAATAEAQQAAAEAAAQAKAAAEAQAKAAIQAQAQQTAAVTPGGVVPQAAQPATPVAAQPVAAAPTADGAKKKSGAGKWLAIIGFALVAIVLLIILLLNVFGSSYQTPIKKLVSAMNSKSTDTDDYMATYPKVFTNLYNDSIKTAKEGYKLIGKDSIVAQLDSIGLGSSMSDMFDQYEKVVGKNMKFSYAIQEKTELDAAVLASTANKYKALAEDLKKKADSVESKTKEVITNAGAKNKDAIDYCDRVKAVLEKAAADIAAIDATAITAGYDVKVRLTIKGDKDEDRGDAVYRVLKINGKWVFDATYSSSLFDSDFIDSLVKMMLLRSY